MVESLNVIPGLAPVVAHDDEEPSGVRLSAVSEHLRSEDERELRSFIRSNGASICYGASPTASVIARMRLFTKEGEVRACGRCGGNEESRRPGSGFRSEKQRGANPALLALLRKLDKENPDLPAAPDGDTVCRDCSGSGWVTDATTKARRSQTSRLIDRRLAKSGRHYPATPLVYRADEWAAQPTGGSCDGGDRQGFSIGESDMALIGRVSKRLQHVQEHEGPAPARAGLELFFAEGSNGMLSLWSLCPAGKVLLRGNQRRLPPEQFFQNLREQQRTKPTDDRGVLFEAADFQAGTLHRIGCRLYNEARLG
jgi:hypothetical protein